MRDLVSLAIVTAIVTLVGAVDESPIVQTSAGEFEGLRYDFDGVSSSVDAFFGLPFARPPIGDLRFEASSRSTSTISDDRRYLQKPVDAERIATRRNATTTRSACRQPGHPMMADTSSEDCLYLDFFRPSGLDSKTMLPTVVWIHGGGYQSGASLMHATRAGAQQFVTHGIIMISIQYRLNVLGFASTGPESFAGNLGLWDMRRALLWIRKNAKTLNVDPKRITLAGCSAGGAAVGALTISEQTRDLFSQAIQMSGSPFAEWATSNKGVQLTEKMAADLGCDDQSSAKVKKCLRSKTYEQLWSAFEKIRDHNDFNIGQFSPRLDADFFSTDFTHLIETAPPKPTLVTFTENEGILFGLWQHLTLFNEHTLTEEQRRAFDAETFKRFVRERLVTKAAFGEQAAEVRAKIFDFYLETVDSQKPLDAEHYVAAYTKLLGDIFFVLPQLLEVRHKTHAGWPTFLVKHTHRRSWPTEADQMPMPSGTTHGYEFLFLFGNMMAPPENTLSDDDRRFRTNMIDTFVAFIKTKVPKTAQQPNFERLSVKRPLVYTDLSTTFEVKDALFAKELKFYDQLMRAYDFDIIRGVHKKTLRSRTEL